MITTLLTVLLTIIGWRAFWGLLLILFRTSPKYHQMLITERDRAARNERERFRDNHGRDAENEVLR